MYGVEIEKVRFRDDKSIIGEKLNVDSMVRLCTPQRCVNADCMPVGIHMLFVLLRIGSSISLLAYRYFLLTNFFKLGQLFLPISFGCSGWLVWAGTEEASLGWSKDCQGASTLWKHCFSSSFWNFIWLGHSVYLFF